MRYLHEKGFPEHQAEMVVAIQELCRDADLAEPDESTLKPKVRRLFKIWHEAEKGHNYFPAQKAVFGRPCNESGRADPPAGRRRQVVK
jgi:hypothetical protein